MRIIEIKALENGAHRNQNGGNVLPDGWAVIPNGMPLENFPFGEVTAEEVDGVMTVTKWVAGTIPEVEEVEETEAEPTVDERVTALEEQYAAIEDALCEMDAANAASIAAIEDALCEMDKEG